MLKNFKKILSMCLTVTLFSLLGCTNPAVYHQTEANVADAVQHAIDARQKSDLSACKCGATLSVDPGPYVDRTPINIACAPGWLHDHIIIRGDDLPFAYFSRTILNGGGRYVLMHNQIGLDPLIRVSMNYSGTVKGALDLLSAKAGYRYIVNCKNVYWQAFITKSFDVAFMPGSSDYLMGKAQGSSGGSISSAGGQSVSAILDDSANAQFSNLKGTLSVWRDLEAGIKQLLSLDGRVMVSEATTTVTVRDRPSNIELVSRFIANYNQALSRQVLIKVQVIDIKLSNDFEYGINWNVVQRAFGNGYYVLNANLGTPLTITPLGGGSFTQFGISNPTASAVNGITGINTLINALSQQGKVSIVTEPRTVSLNNQVSVIRIVNQKGYLASVQNTTVSGGASTASGNTITSQLTPGTVVTGFTLYILPKILGDKIYLQVNADLSILNSIDSISSATGTTPAPTSTIPGSIIQTPNVTQKQFNQRSVIRSGDTLIMAGFRQVSNAANAMQLFDSQALGGRGASQLNTETIVLITPIILGVCA